MSAISNTTAQPPALLQTAGVLPVAPTATVAKQDIAAPPTTSTASPTRDAVNHAAQNIEKFVRSVGRNLDFHVDQSTGMNVVRVVNPDNGELVRQLPSDETLRIARAIDYVQSALVNQRA